MELEADSDANTNRIRNLEVAHGRTMRDNEALQQELATTRAEVIELRARQIVYESRLLDMERQLANLRIHPRNVCC